MEPLRSDEEVAASRSSTRKGEKLKATDCRCLAKISGEDDMWISSPNVSFAPEPILQRRDTALTYHADGMLGPFELFKWPQAFDLLEPHGLAAPMNPKLWRHLDADTPLHDTAVDLPIFADPDVPWLSWETSYFKSQLELPTGEVGVLHPGVRAQFRDAAQEAVQGIEPIWKERFGERKSDTPELATRRGSHRRYILLRLSHMWRALSTVEEVPMSPFDILMWFREFQRILLEVRAWWIYMVVVQPRLNNPEMEAFASPLALRGIVTTRLTVVQDMYRVGIPVWWIRPRHTLTKSTIIFKSDKLVAWNTIMSADKEMVHRGIRRPAPAWGHGDIVRPLSENLAFQLRRYSLSVKPMVAKLLPVWPEDMDKPDVPASAQTPAISDPGPQSVGLSREHRSGPAIAGPSRQSKKAKVRVASKVPQPPPTSPPPPAWVQQSCQGWTRALAAVKDLPCAQQDHGSQAFFYPLPPLHLFYVVGAESAARRFHNWVRIRKWCIGQALNPPADARVLMTTTQWRIALEGQYYYIDPKLLIIPPKSSRADIERLPVEPSPPKRSREAGGEMSRRNLRRLADRVDIAVRFGVQGGFLPFDSASTLVNWGTLQVTQDVAATKSDFWAEVIWELSVLTFRLELLELDRIILAKEYEDTDLFASSRLTVLRQIWSPNQAVCPSWHFDKRQNLLAEAEWDDRVWAFECWADAMLSWPGGAQLNKNRHYFENEKLYEAWEAEVIAFYCREYHARFARLPTIPQRAPWSLEGRLHAA
ncbi:hypothetical protein B0H21DRAFT_726583 [Amylocystis lapponica]|nr:hypothetical protein B0H21DRAFT_726583 [Amylocystis lapponica]